MSVVLDSVFDQSKNGLGLGRRRHMDMFGLQRFHESLGHADALPTVHWREAGHLAELAGEDLRSAARSPETELLLMW